MEAKANLFCDNLESVNHAGGGLGEPSTITARDDFGIYRDRGNGTAKGGDEG